jgi:hypothetical protein
MASAPLIDRAKVDGHKISLGKLSPEDGLDVLYTLTRALGGSFEDIIAAYQSGDKTGLIGAMGNALHGLETAEFKRISRMVVATLTIDDKPGDLSTYQGGLKALLVAELEALKFNFSDFFPASPSGSSPSGATTA